MSREMKDSGVEWIGQIPIHWKIAPLGKVASIITGNTPSMQGVEDFYIEGELLWVKPDNLVQFSPITDTKEKLNHIGRIKARIVPPYTPLVCCIGSIGKIGYSEYEVSFNQQINAMVFDNKCINPKYGLYYISSQEEQHWFYSSGNVLQILNSRNQKKIVMSYPSIIEQEKIVAFLDNRVHFVNSLIEKTKSTIQDYKILKQSIITEAVTKGLDKNVDMKDSGIDWIGEIPKHWKLSKLKYEFRIKKEIAGSEGYNVLSVTQSGLKVKDITINEGQMAADYSKYQFVKVNDYVMNHMDLLTGWVDYSAFNGVTSPDYRVFYMKYPENNSPEYYKYLFQSCYKNRIFYGIAQGVSNLGRWRLQADKFLNFYLPIPPKDEQKKIVDYIVSEQIKYDAIISKKQILLSELEQYKNSLIYEYVTGKKEVE